MSSIPRTQIWCSCDNRACEKLHGLKDTTIYVTPQAYQRMSWAFARECEIRNIKIEVLIR